MQLTADCLPSSGVFPLERAPELPESAEPAPLAAVLELAQRALLEAEPLQPQRAKQARAGLAQLELLKAE